MRILLLGSSGQLGWELQRTLLPLGQVMALDYPQIDVSDAGVIQQTVQKNRPLVIVNASAYTDVDRAETDTESVMAVNATGPGYLAEAARENGAGLIHYSTDYVFDGSLGRPYIETDLPNPLGVYGASKLAGEKAIQIVGGAYLILRTSWVYSLRRESFVTKVLQWARQQPVLRIVADQVGSPTWARMLAEITAQLLAQSGKDPAGWLNERRGLYHLAGSGAASRYEWAQAILQADPRREEHVAQEILPAKTAEFQTPARRPLFSALNCERFSAAFGLELPDWREALSLALETG